MTKKAKMIEDVLFCSCGTKNYKNDWVSGLVDDIIDDGGTVEDTETIECSSCDRRYEVTIGVSLSINVSTVSLEEIIINKYTDKNGAELAEDFFDNLTIGSEVPALNDGDYEHEGMTIRVENGIVKYRFSTEPHPNQMSLL